MKAQNNDSSLFRYYHAVRKMIAMKEAGFSTREIAKYFGITKARVNYHMKNFDKKFGS